MARRRPDWWEAQFFECDLSDQASLDATCHEIQKLGSLWALVNNAAIHIADPIPDMTFDDMVRVLSINTIAPAMLVRAAVQNMCDGGRIVNMCSTAMHGKVGRSSYGASKAALASMTRTWARELGPTGVTVNGISPGPIETSLFRHNKPRAGSAEQAILDTIPVGFIGTTDQVAHVVAFLLAEDQSYLTGEIITLDGGSSTGRHVG
jgi:NAD(P)-dependent dehydrogenase (short-subunit alcohol dehydrogenase family)